MQVDWLEQASSSRPVNPSKWVPPLRAVPSTGLSIRGTSMSFAHLPHPLPLILDYSRPADSRVKQAELDRRDTRWSSGVRQAPRHRTRKDLSRHPNSNRERLATVELIGNGTKSPEASTY